MCQAPFSSNPRSAPVQAVVVSPIHLSKGSSTAKAKTSKVNMNVIVADNKKKRVSFKQTVRCSFIKGCTSKTWYDEHDYDKFRNDVFNTMDIYNNSRKRRPSKTAKTASSSSTPSSQPICMRGIEHVIDKSCSKAKSQARVIAWMAVLDLQDEQWHAQVAAVAAAAKAEPISDDSDSSDSSANASVMMEMSPAASPASSAVPLSSSVNDYETHYQHIQKANAEALAHEYRKVTFRARQEAYLRGLQDQMAAATEDYCDESSALNARLMQARGA